MREPSTEGGAGALPVASAQQVRTEVRRLARRHPGGLALALLPHAAAAACALVAPRLLGQFVEDVGLGTADVPRVVLLVLGFVLLQSLLVTIARYATARLAETVLAELRENFVERLLALPFATVERAGKGDLVTRSTRDADALSGTLRGAVPDALVSLTAMAATLVGLLFVGPLLVLPCLVAAPLLWAATRWYLRRARDGYLRENAAYSRVAEGLTETVEGARTVEALGLARQRSERADRDLARAGEAERYTLGLRTVYLPVCDVSYVLPVVATLVVGGLLHLDGHVSLAAVTTATLYVQQVLVPVDTLLSRLDELQVGGASLARLLGAGGVRAEPGAAAGAVLGNVPVRVPRPSTPPSDGPVLRVRDVRFAYREGQDVLHGVSLDIRPGERLAVVGPSGAGKTTLGRLLSGVHAPRRGEVSFGGVRLTDIPLPELRRRVALVTQEHHVFDRTLRENLLLARPDATDTELEEALTAVGAFAWVADLGLDVPLGAAGTRLPPARAQQISLARLVLADPQVLVLDEATSLLDPRTARDLERSLSAILEGRTVVAIAHRLHTALDADRVVVMADGNVLEVGPHDTLLRSGGVYAQLWASWHGHTQPADPADPAERSSAP